MVLLCSQLVMGPLRASEPWKLLDFFSGTGRISKLAAKSGVRCASYEISLGNIPRNRRKSKRRFPKRSVMDFNGESGFAFLGWKKNLMLLILHFNISIVLALSFQLVSLSFGSTLLKFQPFSPSLYVLRCSKLRLAVILLLQAAFGNVVAVLGPPCSTWVAINAGTSKRTILCPAGDETLLQNRKSNKIATRPVF